MSSSVLAGGATSPSRSLSDPSSGPAGEVPPLADPAWVQQRLGSPGMVLLHVDADSTGYYDGHLPGAVPVDSQDELHEQVRRGPVSQQHFEELLQRKGISRDTHLVLYGGGEQRYAAYAFWLCRYYQHPRVTLLDGGLTAWTRAGLPLVQDVPALPEVGAYRSPAPDESVRVGRVEVVARYAGAPDPTVVLDCRTPQEYAGGYGTPVDLPVEQHRVTGHIPGSCNLPSSRLLTEQGAFLPREQLEAVFAEAGVRPGSDVIAYCRVAERSALVWFALHELLGHPRVRHYDGGWAEYGSLLDVPVARLA